MDFLKDIRETFKKAVASIYETDVRDEDILINETRKEFTGDFTFVIFPLVKTLKKSPAEIGTSIGNWMLANNTNIKEHETVQGFLNLSLSDAFWQGVFAKIQETPKFGYTPSNGKKVLVEFSSPNTNKPLHLGHIRNILLGWSCSKILEANGYDVVKAQIINDRGIAICKSMLAWQKFGNGATPSSTHIKGDHFVGDYYVLFEKEFVAEYEGFQYTDMGLAVYERNKKEGQDLASFFKEYKNTYFNTYSALGAEAKAMLIAWEAKDPEVMELWKK